MCRLLVSCPHFFTTTDEGSTAETFSFLKINFPAFHITKSYVLLVSCAEFEAIPTSFSEVIRSR